MNKQFFAEQLRTAQIKLNEDNKIKNQIAKSRNEILKQSAKPIINFLNYCNDNYTFNGEKLISYDWDVKERINRKETTYLLEIPISRLRLENFHFNYIGLRVNEDMIFQMSFSDNISHIKKTFFEIESFIKNFSDAIVRARD